MQKRVDHVYLPLLTSFNSFQGTPSAKARLSTQPRLSFAIKPPTFTSPLPSSLAFQQPDGMAIFSNSNLDKSEKDSADGPIVEEAGSNEYRDGEKGHGRVVDTDQLSELGRIERTTTHRGLKSRHVSMIAMYVVVQVCVSVTSSLAKLTLCLLFPPSCLRSSYLRPRCEQWRSRWNGTYHRIRSVALSASSLPCRQRN